MGGKTTSRTEKDSLFGERLIGEHHHKTTISDGEDSVSARGETAEKAESRASEKWSDKKGK